MLVFKRFAKLHKVSTIIIPIAAVMEMKEGGNLLRILELVSRFMTICCHTTSELLTDGMLYSSLGCESDAF